MTEQVTSAPSVALLGTGIMGAGMARSMLRAGMPLRVWNRTLDRAEPLEADGAIVCGSPAEAVRGADIIVTMLADGPAVLDAMTAAVPGFTPGQIWAQTSTVGTSWLEELAEFARDRGIVFLDAPVLGTRQPAEQGQLIVFAAGPGEASESIRERVRPVFEAIGQKTVWLPEVGAATRLKLVANSWVLALTNAVGEAVALARGLGVAPEAFLEAMSGGALDCPYLHVKARAILSDDFTPSFSVALAGKDAGLIVEAAEAAGLHLDVAPAVRERFRRAAALGHGEEDMAAAYFASFNGAATQ
ncbi:MAG TPA: NAD(P)-dependent oxidoreductase [Streptosporangiaceae bacterium]|jgi:3-hydroxyisobutyrate dehydrogenase|nr:NAD(P)-dependent oxidoreductase [Streptosporangiaceae bacterium]